MENQLSGLKGSCTEILRHFSHFYPTHTRSVYDSTGMILAVLYWEVPHMLHANISPRPSGSGDQPAHVSYSDVVPQHLFLTYSE